MRLGLPLRRPVERPALLRGEASAVVRGAGDDRCRVEVRQELHREQEEGEEDREATDRADQPGAPVALGPPAADHSPISSTWSAVFSSAVSQMLRRPTHIATPRKAMTSTAIAAEITPSPRSPHRTEGGRAVSQRRK